MPQMKMKKLLSYCYFYRRSKRMKISLIICCLFLGLSAFGQNIKKKLYGTYEGTISGYKMDIGQTVVDVNAVAIQIKLTEDGLAEQKLGSKILRGTWRIKSDEKTYYVIVLKLTGQEAEERVILYKKTRTMKREGIFPQPDANLVQVKE
jgi:hypothetical protein